MHDMWKQHFVIVSTAICLCQLVLLSAAAFASACSQLPTDVASVKHPLPRKFSCLQIACFVLLPQKPLEYTGVSNERTSLQGPECKTEVKFGADVVVTLYGGDTKKTVFATEKDFYTAVTVNKTLDFNMKPLR